MTAEDPLDGAPGEGGDGGGERGGGERIGRDPVRGDRGAGVEAIPTDPEHAGADHAEHHAVRGHLVLPEADARPEDDAKEERGPAGAHVHHGAAGEVDRGDLGVTVPDAVHEAAGAPDHVGEREVDHEHPDRDEGQDGREFHALGDGAHDQGGRDDREHQLVHREDVLRDPVGVVGVGRGRDVLEEEVFRAPQERAVEIGAEDQAVTKGPPEDRDETGDAQALGEHRQHVLLADQATVEEREAGQRHEEDERGARHHPGVVAGAGDAGQAFAGVGIVHIGLEGRDAFIRRGSGRGSGSWRLRYGGQAQETSQTREHGSAKHRPKQT